MDGGDGGAGDGSFDACECIYNHGAGMQRLINYLRQSQSECTDAECFNDVPGGPAGSSQGDPGNFTAMAMMMTWIALALVLFFMRPAVLRKNANEKNNNDRDSHRDHDDVPPAPPIM